MTFACPHGHASGTADYCDQCGSRLAGTEPAPPATPEPAEPCGACGAPQSGSEHFCEACGYDFAAKRTWEALIVADRVQFERAEASEIVFPEATPARVLALDQAELHIGRRSAARGIAPDIDLAAPGGDPAVSHVHAALRRQADGSYAVVDLGSSNGTTLNDGADPIAAHKVVPLQDGDRIRLGAWTAITIRAVSRGDRTAGPDG